MTMTGSDARPMRVVLYCLLLLAALFSAPLHAQEAPEPRRDGLIDVDFVKKDIHTVMHYIGLRANLDIIVEGTIDVVLTIIHRNVDPRDVIRSICKANKLDFIEDGTSIIIKARPQDSSLANVVKGEMEGRFNVNFLSHDLVPAIMEVASVTQTDALIPSAPPQELGGMRVTFPRGVERPVPPEGEGDGPAEPARVGEGATVDVVLQRKVSMYMRDATAEAIMLRLAALGGLDVEVRQRADDQLVQRVSFEFKYRPMRMAGGTEGGPAIQDPDVTLERGEWTLPGADVNQVRTEVRNLMSPRGMVVVDRLTNYVVIYDMETPYMERISAYMDAVAERAVLVAEQTADPMVIREYPTVRDVADQALVDQIREVVGEAGKVIPNPERNTIIISAPRSRLPMLDELMRTMDTLPQQVMITSQLVEVTLDEYIGYGLEIFSDNPATNLNDGRFVVSGQDGGGTVGGLYGQPTGFDPFFGTFSNPRVDIRLELLANEGKVKTLSKPWTMASNKKEARIEVGQEIPYLSGSAATGGATTVTVSFKEVSILMLVTPTVLEGGLLRLQVDVTVREVIGNVAIEGNNTPVLSKRQSKTDVFIRDGETLVMGGLMRERERMDESGIPFLKDIPFLGYLFKSANKTTNKTDLLFFVRPTIVNANGNRNEGSGLDIVRDLQPVVYEDADAKLAGIRIGRFFKLGLTPKPRHFNPAARPNTAAEVDPAG